MVHRRTGKILNVLNKEKSPVVVSLDDMRQKKQEDKDKETLKRILIAAKRLGF